MDKTDEDIQVKNWQTS